jgi:anti-sigma B factor antagonist
MKITKEAEGSRLTISIEGKLDALTAPELGKVIGSSLNGITELIFDLGSLEYTSSAGLREFLEAQQIMDEQGTMILKNVNELVMDILEETGFTDILEIEGAEIT